MRALKTFFRFYIDSSINEAVTNCALAGITVLVFDLQWQWPVFLFLASASITGYNFVKYAGEAKFHYRSLTKHLRAIQIFSFFCFLVLIYAVFLQSIQFIITAAILGFFTLIYAVPFLPSHKNLRAFKSLKIFIVAFVWAGATLWLPMVDQRSLLTLSVGLNTLSYFIFILAMILPFEIRDTVYDDPQLGTFPQRFGIPKTKKIGYGLLVGFVGLTALTPVSTWHSIGISALIAVLIGIYIRFSTKNQRDYYASFWVQITPVFWFLLLWLT